MPATLPPFRCLLDTMGNNCGVEDTPIAFDQLDTIRRAQHAPRFPCNLKSWRLYGDANRRWCVAPLRRAELDPVCSLPNYPATAV